MKRLVSVILIMCLTTIPMISAAESKTLSLTIAEAQQKAVENSRQAVLDDIEIKNKQLVMDNSKYDLLPESGATEDEAYKTNVEPIEIETALEMAKRNKTDNLNALRLNVRKTSLDIELASKALATEKQKYGILKQKLAIINAKFKQGMVTQNDVDNAQYSYDSKAVDIQKAQDNIDELVLSFKTLLNLPMDNTAIEIKDDITYDPNVLTNLNAAIDSAIKNSSSVYQNNQNIIMKQNNLNNVIKYRGQGTTNYYDAQNDLESAKLDLDDAKNNIEVNIRNKYNDLLNGRDRVELAIKYANLMKRAFDISATKYKNGTVSKESSLNSQLDYIDAIYQKYAAIHDYSITKSEFSSMIE